MKTLASPGAMALVRCMMQTNLACALAHDGAFEDWPGRKLYCCRVQLLPQEAQRACDKALQLQPKALLPLKTCLDLKIQRVDIGIV